MEIWCRATYRLIRKNAVPCEGPVQAVSIVFSARKSVLPMMYGRYMANGTIDLDRTLADLGIDDVGGLLPIERQARLRDLLAARSGVYHAAANGGDDAAAAPPTWLASAWLLIATEN